MVELNQNLLKLSYSWFVISEVFPIYFQIEAMEKGNINFQKVKLVWIID